MMNKGYTVTNKHHASYEWEIMDFDVYLNLRNPTENNTSIYSLKFMSTNKETYWQLKLVFQNNYKITHEYLRDQIKLELCRFRNVDEIIKYSVYILSNSKEKKFIKIDYIVMSQFGMDVLILSKKLLLEKKEENLPNNSLTVGIDLTLYDTPNTISINPLLSIPKRQMTQDYKELYSTKFGSDVCLNVSGKEIQAHKTCLIARSPVLAAMFSHEMLEKKTNKVDITDLNPAIFEKMLEYIYTDEVNNLDAHAEDLLEAANKYQLQSLKDMCQESLSKTLTVENALKIRTLADLHGADQLLKFTTNFMVTNLENSVETQNFQDFKKENPTAAFDLLKNLMFSLKKT